jgi:hypothetical protein
VQPRCKGSCRTLPDSILPGERLPSPLSMEESERNRDDQGNPQFGDERSDRKCFGTVDQVGNEGDADRQPRRYRKAQTKQPVPK